MREKLSENTEKPNELWKIMKINRLTKQKGYYNKHMAQYKKELIFSPRTIAKTFQKQFANLASNIVKKLPDSTGKFGIPSVQQHYEGLRICEKKNEQEVQLQWTPAFTRQRVGYQSNQKPLHHYQHLTKQLNSYIHS